MGERCRNVCVCVRVIQFEISGPLIVVNGADMIDFVFLLSV